MRRAPRRTPSSSSTAPKRLPRRWSPPPGPASCPGLLQVLGPAARGILNSGDPVADKNNRDEFLAGYDAKHQITPDGADRSILVIGDKDWPLPIPLVKDKDKWRFDSVAGREEVLYRRVGENEDYAIEVALAYVDAQREYAAADPEGKGTHAYAQRIVSHPGRRTVSIGRAKPAGSKARSAKPSPRRRARATSRARASRSTATTTRS